MSEVKHLAINYKTAEDFKKFREYGAQELQMTKELEGNVIDANMDSPFYGIYVGDALAARMCLYRREDEHAPIFDPPHDYMVIWKLEVLEKYRGRGFGSKLIDYAKSYGIPIKAISPAELPRILRDPWLRAPEIRHRTRYVGRSTDLVSGRLCTQLDQSSIKQKKSLVDSFHQRLL